MSDELVARSIILSKPSLYYAVCESAQLLEGRRVDQQVFDEMGWWVRSIVLEFVVPIELSDRFERKPRELYDGFISIIIEHKAALST